MVISVFLLKLCILEDNYECNYVIALEDEFDKLNCLIN